MSTPQPAPPSISDEMRRVAARRVALGTGTGASAPVTGLALSGGGIRSATFALGVLQALNEVPVPVDAHTGTSTPAGAKEPRLSHLLTRFDYLSTVSGGGYVGSFFCSLFVPGRLESKSGAIAHTIDADAPHRAARLASQVLANDPPGRMRIEAESDVSVLCKQPLAWLRENGRYLAPNGAGDLIYACALAIRNWLAIQYVLATVVVSALAGLMLIRALLVGGTLHFGAQTVGPLLAAGSPLPSLIASGLLWGIALAIVLLWSFPAGIAFWLVQPDRGMSDAGVPRHTSLAAWGDLAIGLALAVGMPQLLRSAEGDRYLAFAGFFFGIGVQALLGFGVYQVSRRRLSVVEHRVILTRDLALSMQCAALVALFALADSLALHVYNWLVVRTQGITWPTALPALLAAAIWAVRHASVLIDQKNKPGWLSRLPIDLLAGLLGFAIALALVVLWATLIDWMVWNGEHAEPLELGLPSVLVLTMIAVVTGAIALIVGRFPAFINLSSLQSIYSARLTRAYLGASNGERLQARLHSEGAVSVKGGSVAEPLASDQLAHDAYYAPDVLAPLHVINSTVNQTTDSNEQLVQRDRKGLPMAVLPTGFTIDGRYAAFQHAAGKRAVEQPLSIGQWIGTSGAAVATGLGRTTTRGLSLLLGLANVRLGTWWQSGQGPSMRTSRRGIARVVEGCFGTQAYLLSELTAEFHGLNRRWQYLTDGGHFENTGIYELLRSERNVRLIVCCDDGADVDGRFGALANLIRLARIDFGLEIEANRSIGADPLLKDVFGRPEDLLPGATTRKCAMLFDVTGVDAATKRRELRCRIVVIKPRVIDGAPLDVLQYAGAHPSFPNESTAQQFFDEAQWESYRRLGVAVGRTVFGLDDATPPGYADALWKRLWWR